MVNFSFTLKVLNCCLPNPDQIFYI